MPSVAVVGGGITGLVAAHEMRGRADVVVLEGSTSWGGKIRTATLDGAMVEDGPDSFLPRDDTPLALCRNLGVGDQLVEPADFGAWLWHGGRLVPLPEGAVFGLPSSPISILKTRLLSPRGVVRAAGDFVVGGPLAGPDVSIGEFVERRFGAEVLERLVDPLLAGTRAGDPRKMSLAAAVPQIDQIARTHRSVTLGLRALRKRAGLDAKPRFYSLRGGMQKLVDALLDASGADLRLDTPVSRVAADADGFVIDAAEEQIAVDAVILAVPAHAAAALIAELSPAASDALDRIRYATVATASFVYPDRAVRIPATGSGILVPRSENRTIAGCTWFSAKWPHVAPPGTTVLRAFAGRAEGDRALAQDDDDLLDAMEADLGAALGIREPARDRRLARWVDGIPQLEVGHLDLIASIERELAAWPGLALAGAGYRGTGIPDCIDQANRAVSRVLAAS